MEVRPKACERAAEFVSLELDGELSLFERAILKRHLQRCWRCEIYADELRGMTALLRSAPAEQVHLPVGIVGHRRVSFRLVQGAAATAAIAAVGVWFGISAAGSNRERAPVSTLKTRPASLVVAGRDDWSAGLPRTVRVVQLIPGGLYTRGL